MHTDAHRSYLEGEILAADPLKLVQLLYRGALDAVQAARQHLNAGEIPNRSRNINKALSIVNELMLSLDHARGEGLSRELVELYDYIQRLLIAANVKQSEAPLIEAEKLLQTLLDAWQQCCVSTAPVPPETLLEQNPPPTTFRSVAVASC